jgi:TonB family protein
VEIPADGPTTALSVRLLPQLTTLAPVQVTGEVAATPAHLADFYRRRASGKGRFVTEQDIKDRSPPNTMDVFRGIPGVDIDSKGISRGAIQIRGNSCLPFVWLDGSPLGAGYFEPSMINPADIAGIEVYSGTATVPAEFMGSGGQGGCGVIAIWTKRLERRAKAPSGPGVTQEEVDRITESFTVFTEDQVDERAYPAPGGAIRPDYPDSLLKAGVGGRVIIEFVIDTMGIPQVTTMQVLASSNELLSGAVMAAVRNVRYVPARRNGRRVQQVVRLPVAFRVPDPAPPSP